MGMILSYIRTMILYGVLILVVRLMGKRQIGEMEPAEFVVTMLISNLAAIPMEDGGIPLMSALVPILTVLGIQLLLSVASVRWVGFRRVLCGKPVILIDDGTILEENLRKTRITLDELTEHLREKDVLDVSQVQYAILETNGQLSVFPFPRYRPPNAMEQGVAVREQLLPVTVVSDGKVLEANLRLLGRDRQWLMGVLRSRGACLQGTLLLTANHRGEICFIPRKEQP